MTQEAQGGPISRTALTTSWQAENPCSTSVVSGNIEEMSCGIDGRLVLEHHIRDGKEIFIPLEALTVRHPSFGERVIPTGEHRFASDLASVPWPFVWLIGRTGQHLRAAIVHDWLIHALDSSNPPVDNRMAADDVFRDLMRADQVSAVRRYLIYLAVRFATMWKRKSTVRRSISVLLQTAAIGVVLAPATVLVMLTAGLFKLVERVSER